jgi:hypothetical protein
MEQARFKEFKTDIIPGVGIVYAVGSSAPTDGKAGYAKGCQFVVPGTGIYVNEGTDASCDFNVDTSRDITGDVTGDVTGNVTGNVVGNIKSTIAAGSISTAPTQAELVAILGAAATAGAGARRLVKGNAGTGSGNVYTCVTDGTSWFAVNMPVGTS